MGNNIIIPAEQKTQADELFKAQLAKEGGKLGGELRQARGIALNKGDVLEPRIIEGLIVAERPLTGGGTWTGVICGIQSGQGYRVECVSIRVFFGSVREAMFIAKDGVGRELGEYTGNIIEGTGDIRGKEHEYPSMKDLFTDCANNDIKFEVKDIRVVKTLAFTPAGQEPDRHLRNDKVYDLVVIGDLNKLDPSKFINAE